MSALSFSLAHPGADRAALREMLEQGVFGSIIAALCLCLLLSLLMFSPIHCGLDVQAPASAGGTVFSSLGALEVKLTARSEFVAAGIWVPDANLDAYLANKATEAPDLVLTLQADRRLPYAEVKRLLRRIEKAGVSKTYLVTEGNPMTILAEPWFGK